MLNVNRKLVGLRDVNGYSADAARDKEYFHKAGRQFLHALAKELGMLPGTYEVRNNMGGPAVSGEVTLHSDTLYVQLMESCMAPGIHILYRACRGRNDYSGLQNHWVSMRELSERQNCERFVQRLKALGGLG